MLTRLSHCRVSVLMPVKDGSASIDYAIQSVLCELSDDDELIVINDGSVDDTCAKLNHYKDQVTVLDNPGVGIVDALNHGISWSHGKYIARCDADDQWMGGRLTPQLEHLLDRGAAACFGGVEYIDLEGKVTHIEVPPTDENHLRKALLKRNILVHGSVVARRSDLAEVGGYRHVPGAEDYDLWMRLLRYSRITAISVPVYRYTLNDRGSHRAKRQVQARSSLNILREHARETGEFSALGLLRNTLSWWWPAERPWYRP